MTQRLTCPGQMSTIYCWSKRPTKKLYDWLCCNKLSLNVNKTYYTLFRPPSNVHVDIDNKLSINNNPITMVRETDEQESIKFLGIYLDKDFKQHINFLCSSTSKCIFAINRVKHILPIKSLKSLYFALIVVGKYRFWLIQPHTWLKLENKPHTWLKLENEPHTWLKLENKPHTWSKLENEPHTWSKLGNEPCMVTVSGTDRDPRKFAWIIIF